MSKNEDSTWGSTGLMKLACDKEEDMSFGSRCFFFGLGAILLPFEAPVRLLEKCGVDVEKGSDRDVNPTTDL